MDNPPSLSRLHSPPSPRLLPWLMLLFVGSGTAALIYEIVWLQLLQLVIGLTSVSLGVLLGTFMGGMCLGSLLLPRLISPRRHPLLVYAGLEAGIALTGLAMLFLIPWVSQLYTDVAGRWPSLVLRGTVAALCLLPPTVLMGATLPAMARWIETNREGVSWLGFFYGGNIGGAVLGCLLAGFYFLRVHDAVVATYAAAGLNLAVALIACLIAVKSRRKAVMPAPGPSTEPEPVVSDAEPAASPARGSALIYAAIAFSGMAALGAEVVWTRLLSLLMGGTVYTFSLILAVFLVGLGLGSSAGSHISRTVQNPRFALGVCQTLLIGAVAWSALMMARSLPYWPIDPSLSRSPWFNFQLDLARSFWAMLPAAILWGASFPLALASMAARGQDSGRLVGQVYAANTVGAIAGALLFSLFAVPAYGTQFGQRLIIAISAVGALLAFAAAWRQSPRAEKSADSGPFSFVRFAAFSAIALGLALWLGLSVSPTPWGLVAHGRFMATFRNRFAPGFVPEERIPSSGKGPDIFCTYMGEGLNGSVAVTKWMSGIRSFHSAGKVQASTEPADMRLQRMLGHLSALLHKKPESALVVACGAGVTAGSFVVHPEIKRIVICDIEPLVPTVVAPMFAQENFNVIGDKRTQVVFDDGRHFIRSTRGIL